MNFLKTTAAAAIVAVGALGAADVAPAKAAGLGEVLITGIGIVAGAGAVAYLTGGAAYGPMLMSAMGVETAAMGGAAGAGAGMGAGMGAGAGAGAAAAEAGTIGALAAHGLHVTWHAARAGAVVLGGLFGGYVTNNLFYGW